VLHQMNPFDNFDPGRIILHLELSLSMLSVL